MALTLGENELNWIGKNKAEAKMKTNYKMIPCKEESVNWDTTNNIFIEGDNLDALKLLQKEYTNKIKMIYLDPPYNVNVNSNYNDKMPQSEWLSFMYSRLVLVRNLLRSDGIMFISISEKQLAVLKLICNEIFYPSHFMATLIWRRRTPAGVSTTGISSDHEYILCYEKKKAKLLGTKRTFKKYSNPDNDPRGVWVRCKCTISLTSKSRPNQCYDFINPDTGKVFKGNPNNIWRWIKSTMDRKIKNKEVIFPENGEPYLKIFKSKAKTLYSPMISILKGIGINAEGTRTIKKLLGLRAFSYTKPVSLMQCLIEQSTKDNDIILDIFAGSCTTAHAVMKSNYENSSTNKFIMIQSPEKDLSNYNFGTIANLGRQRIIKAGNEIKNYNPMFYPDIGFKTFKLEVV